MVAPPQRGKSQMQDNTAKEMIRLLKIYRKTAHNEARHEYAKAALVLAQRLVELPDAGGGWPPQPPSGPPKSPS